MVPLTALLLAGALDAGAALEHASRLAALGPHAFGSPRTELAAEYVAGQLREAGVSELRRQQFSAGGRRGINVIGVLRGSGPGFVVLGAHHDSPEGSPGAWGGGGVAVLIEAARSLQELSRTRTLVLASWDGGAVAGWPGARAWLDGLGADARHAVAVLVVEGAGRPGGVPLLQTPARPDPLRPGRSTAAPAWLVRRALQGAAAGGVPLGVADPRFGWLFQVADRVGVALRPRGDRPFVSDGLPALVFSDDGPSLGPRPEAEADTVEALDAVALGKLGEALVAAAGSVAAGSRGAEGDAGWFAASGVVLGEPSLLLIGAASLVPVAAAALSGGAAALLLRAVHAGGFGLLLWRAPVAALWCLLLPNLALARPRSRLLARLALLPALALLAAVALAGSRGEPAGPLYAGLWLAPWELAAAGLTLLAAGLRPPEPKRRVPAGGRRRR
jgi:hypothetical protein